jgi:hypothetical protein
MGAGTRFGQDDMQLNHQMGSIFVKDCVADCP